MIIYRLLDIDLVPTNAIYPYNGYVYLKNLNILGEYVLEPLNHDCFPNPDNVSWYTTTTHQY